VTRIYLERTNDGADAALQIESADGTKAILRFRATALPETVDGVVARRQSQHERSVLAEELGQVVKLMNHEEQVERRYRV
jgi:hypothetical protein